MLCLFHNWSKWKDIQKGDLVKTETDKVPVGMYITQERICAKCNKRERNTINTRY